MGITKEKDLVISYYINNQTTEDRVYIRLREVDGVIEMVKKVVSYPIMGASSFTKMPTFSVYNKLHNRLLDELTVKQSDEIVLKGQAILDEHDLYIKFSTGKNDSNIHLQDSNWEIDKIFFSFIRDARIDIICD